MTGVTSADGALVYAAHRNGHWRIYYQPALDATPTEVARAPGGDASAPALAPDGSQVAFEVAGAGLAVCPVPVPGDCRAIRTPTGSAVRPDWHPGTGEIVFVRYVADGKDEDSDLFITEGTAIRPLLRQTGAQDYPRASRDGRWLAYAAGQTVNMHRSAVQVVQHLWLLDLQTGLARPLVPAAARDLHPRWSPAGDQLAFASNRTGQFEIWVVGSDGDGLRQVTSGDGAKTWPVWSPDGRFLMFTLARDGRQSLWIVDADGRNPRAFEPFGSAPSVELRDADWR